MTPCPASWMAVDRSGEYRVVVLITSSQADRIRPRNALRRDRLAKVSLKLAESPIPPPAIAVITGVALLIGRYPQEVWVMLAETMTPFATVYVPL